MNTFEVRGDELIETDTPAVVLAHRARQAEECFHCTDPAPAGRLLCDGCLAASRRSRYASIDDPGRDQEAEHD